MDPATDYTAPVAVCGSVGVLPMRKQSVFQPNSLNVDLDLNLDVWSDKELLAGSHVKPEILEQIAETDVSCALMSRDYLASDYCKEVMQEALQAVDSRDCRVVPVIVRKTTGWQAEYDNRAIRASLGSPGNQGPFTNQFSVYTS